MSLPHWRIQVVPDDNDVDDDAGGDDEEDDVDDDVDDDDEDDVDDDDDKDGAESPGLGGGNSRLTNIGPPAQAPHDGRTRHQAQYGPQPTIPCEPQPTLPYVQYPTIPCALQPTLPCEPQPTIPPVQYPTIPCALLPTMCATTNYNIYVLTIPCEPKPTLPNVVTTGIKPSSTSPVHLCWLCTGGAMS